MTEDRLQDRLRDLTIFAKGETHDLLFDAAARIDALERDRDQGTGALGLLLDTATLKTVEAVEGRVYRWDGVRGWIAVADEVAVEAAAQALCAWPLVSVDDRQHGTATHMATDALAAPWRSGETFIPSEACCSAPRDPMRQGRCPHVMKCMTAGSCLCEQPAETTT